jgi:hypothetical protein
LVGAILSPHLWQERSVRWAAYRRQRRSLIEAMFREIRHPFRQRRSR